MNFSDYVAPIAFLMAGAAIGWMARGEHYAANSGLTDHSATSAPIARGTSAHEAASLNPTDGEIQPAPPSEPVIVEEDSPPPPPELPQAVKDKLPNSPFALSNAAIKGDVEKAKVAIIGYIDYQ